MMAENIGGERIPYSQQSVNDIDPYSHGLHSESTVGCKVLQVQCKGAKGQN
jgi:hypothetical protein